MRLLIGLSVLVLAACASPEERLKRIQRDFVANRPMPDVFEIRAESDTVQLPLPPSAQYAGALRDFAATYREKTYAIDPEKLHPDAQIALRQFQVALDSICARQAPALSEAPGHALHEVLSHFCGSSGLRHPDMINRVVEQIPEYYTQVHQHWTPPDPSSISESTTQAMATLDYLQRIEENLPGLSIGYREQLQKTIPEARAAVKDFIGLCQSGLLE